MRVRLRNAVLFLTAIILFAAAGCASVGTEPPTSAFSTTTATAGGAQTLENLQTAFNGESNANAKYIAFAKKADAEGYTKVASLFRAAARSEEIHKTNHAAVIKAMGGNPAADIKPADVKTTAENLKSAVEGETYERDTMYPGFVAEARAAGTAGAAWPAGRSPRSCAARGSTTRWPARRSTRSTPTTSRPRPARWCARSCGR